MGGKLGLGRLQIGDGKGKMPIAPPFLRIVEWWYLTDHEMNLVATDLVPGSRKFQVALHFGQPQNGAVEVLGFFQIGDQNCGVERLGDVHGDGGER